MNGQIQYGSARPLTSRPTVARKPRTADPDRFPSASAGVRSVALLFGSSLLLGVLLTAAPRNVPDVAAGVLLGGAWLSLVLAMTLPREPERAGQELVRRLAQFRHELHAVGDAPTRAVLEGLIRRADDLGLREDEVAEDIAQLRACLDALDLRERLLRGEFPSAEPPDPTAPGERCYFVCAVRFGRRRADQFGHLVLTSAWLKFRGALDVSVAWGEIALVRRDARDVLVALSESRRVLRFCCHSHTEAAQAGVLADYLGRAARVEPTGPAEYQASL